MSVEEVIAENLHRAELTVLERSEQVARYAELEAKKKDEERRLVAQVEPLKPGHGQGAKGGERKTTANLSFVSDTATKTGADSAARAWKLKFPKFGEFAPSRSAICMNRRA
ncbi:MAG: hypothetical protein ACK4QW_06600, partial [Alphaproteobacteria bacterium]